MPWTEKNFDTLIAAAAGIGGTLLGTFVNRFWEWWDQKRHLKATVETARLNILHTESKDELCTVLVMLKDLLLANSELLKRPNLQKFFDLWLRTDLLHAGRHARLLAIDSSEGKAQLKSDAALLRL